jgi:hypothetical protein
VGGYVGSPGVIGDPAKVIKIVMMFIEEIRADFKQQERVS